MSGDSDSIPVLATMSKPMALDRARERGIFSALDVQFASRLGALYGETSPEVLWGLALACRQEAHGHVCADLARLESLGLVSEKEGEARSFPALPEGFALDRWLEVLRESRLIGDDRDTAEQSEVEPLVLDAKGRLYLRRSFSDQARLAAEVHRRGHRADLSVDWPLAEAGIDRLVPSNEGAESETDWTRVALRTGLARPLSIITGGPGTGKTTLVVRLIALLVEQALACGADPPTLRLLAPTGKAAAAMTASFMSQRESLEVSSEVRLALPTGAETIHRALLRQTRRDAFGKALSKPIDADIVVVDEASMVDLAQMRDLFSVCSDVDRLVLLGDPDQLASVDSGAALAELCSIAPTRAEKGAIPDFAMRGHQGESVRPQLMDSIVTLRESHRFAAGGAIGRLAAAIRKGDADLVLSLLEDPNHPEVELGEADSVAGVRARLIEAVRGMQGEIEAAVTPGAKLERLSSRRVLCTHRSGPLGVEALCDVLDDAAASYRRTSSRAGWWRGRLLLVTRNAPEQDLWNGDVGLVEETSSGLRAIFPDAGGGVRTLSAGRLPSFESAIAMSVHKSQGSEYDVVDLVLGRSGSRLMTRELLYTGVTRARERLCIHGSREAIRDALERRVERDSGLSELLLESDS
jgi:exodeoxyribonuclease V alpha subunit